MFEKIGELKNGEKCFYCEQEIEQGQKTKRIKYPGDRRRKTEIHFSCWADWGVKTIKSLIGEKNEEF